MRKIRIKFMKEAREFLDNLPPKVKEKFYDVIRRVMNGERDVRIFKKLDDHDFYEFRVYSFPNQYRIFAFWDYDEDSLIVATHGIIKKDQKLRNSEFKRMEKLRREYKSNKQKK